MMRVLLIAISLACLTACEASAPVTRLQYVELTAAGYNYHLKFEADQPLLDLFAKNKHQKTVLAELVCSLDDDHNFDVEHRLKYFARGGFDFVQQSGTKQEPSYMFSSTIHFWESPANEMGSEQSLAKEELERLLKGRASVPCKIRMTVYLSSPYYSDTMFVPSKDILAVAKPRQVPQ